MQMLPLKANMLKNEWNGTYYTCSGKNTVWSTSLDGIQHQIQELQDMHMWHVQSRKERAVIMEMTNELFCILNNDAPEKKNTCRSTQGPNLMCFGLGNISSFFSRIHTAKYFINISENIESEQKWHPATTVSSTLISTARIAMKTILYYRWNFHFVEDYYIDRII